MADYRLIVKHRYNENSKSPLLVFIMVLLLFSVALRAQDKKQYIEKEISKHSLNIELFGKGFYFGNLSYEYALKRNLVFGSGLGFQAQHTNSYDAPDYKNFKELYLTIPLYMVFKTHKNKSRHIVFTLGVTPLMSIKHSGYNEYKKYFSQVKVNTSRVRKVDIFPNFAIGYESNSDTFYFRISIYAQYIGENGWFPSVVPWLGITFGRHFSQKKKEQ